LPADTFSPFPPALPEVVSLSAALSFPLPGLRVMERLALWSSDFPPDQFLSWLKDKIRTFYPGETDQATTCSASAYNKF